MTVSTPSSNLGRHVFGVAALAFGLGTLAWHDYNGSHQLRYIVYAASAALIFGGAAMQLRRTAKTGAAVLGAAYLVYVLLCLPGIVAAPRIYNSWGNFFEQFSLLTGAAIVYARLSSAWSPETLNRIGRILLGICAASFTLEQAFYLDATAHLVPKWLPPSQMFWAVATTVFFALAAVALLANQMALLAARLLTLMLVLFGLLVWVPLVIPDPHNHTNWSENAETFAIAGAAWILADLLGEVRRNEAGITQAK
jgi:predicted tellurium resistance membrane protein TerC